MNKQSDKKPINSLINECFKAFVESNEFRRTIISLKYINIVNNKIVQIKKLYQLIVQINLLLSKNNKNLI